jgi:hypothetical protein
MDEVKNEDLKRLLISLKGKKIKIITSDGFWYTTSNLQVNDGSVQFIDKLGNRVYLSLDQLKQVMELNK